MKVMSMIFGLLAMLISLIGGPSQASIVTVNFEDGTLGPLAVVGNTVSSVIPSALDESGATILPFSGLRMAEIAVGDYNFGGLKWVIPGAKEANTLSFWWRAVALSDDPLNDPIFGIFRSIRSVPGWIELSVLSTSGAGDDWTFASFDLPAFTDLGDRAVPPIMFFRGDSFGPGTYNIYLDDVTFDNHAGTVPSPGTLLLVLAAFLAFAITRSRQPRTRRLG